LHEPVANLPRPKAGAFVRVVNLGPDEVSIKRNDAVFGVPLKKGSWTPFHRVAPGTQRFDFNGASHTLNLDPAERATLVVVESPPRVEVLRDEPRTSGDDGALVAVASLGVSDAKVTLRGASLPMPQGATLVGEAVRVASGKASVGFGDGSPDQTAEFKPGGGYTIFVARLPDGTAYRRIVHNNPPLRLGTVNAPVGSS
jgi:hypothetical protein